MQGGQDFRIFPSEFADSIVDATSYEEVEGVLGPPTIEFGSGIVYSQWAFENGEVYEINSRSNHHGKQPVGIMFPSWHFKRIVSNTDTGKCVIAMAEILSEKRPNMAYKIEVWPLEHPIAFLSVEDETKLVIDREGFLESGLAKVEEKASMLVQRTNCDGVYGLSFPKTIIISKTAGHQCSVVFLE